MKATLRFARRVDPLMVFVKTVGYHAPGHFDAVSSQRIHPQQGVFLLINGC